MLWWAHTCRYLHIFICAYWHMGGVAQSSMGGMGGMGWSRVGWSRRPVGWEAYVAKFFAVTIVTIARKIIKIIVDNWAIVCYSNNRINCERRKSVKNKEIYSLLTPGARAHLESVTLLNRECSRLRKAVKLLRTALEDVSEVRDLLREDLRDTAARLYPVDPK